MLLQEKLCFYFFLTQIPTNAFASHNHVRVVTCMQESIQCFTVDRPKGEHYLYSVIHDTNSTTAIGHAPIYLALPVCITPVYLVLLGCVLNM